MNDGLIASRYARALLLYVEEQGDGERVVGQAGRLVAAISASSQLRSLLSDPSGVSSREKMDLLRSALSPEPPAPALERFLELVLRSGRMPLIRLILKDFTIRYYRSRGILTATLVTATEASDALEEKIRRAAGRMTRSQVRIEKTVDPAILGGFILTVDGSRCDASLRRQLQTLRSEFTQKNKRIV